MIEIFLQTSGWEWLVGAFDDFYVFTALVIFVVGALGLVSRSMAISSMGAYLIFAAIAVETGDDLLVNIIFVTFALIFVGMAFKIIRFEGMQS